MAAMGFNSYLLLELLSELGTLHPEIPGETLGTKTSTIVYPSINALEERKLFVNSDSDLKKFIERAFELDEAGFDRI